MRILLGWFNKLWDVSGGMARIECAMANEFIRRGHEAAIFLEDRAEGRSFFPVDEKVKFYNMNCLRNPGLKKISFSGKVIREILRPLSATKEREWQFHCKIPYYAQPVQKMIDDFQPDIIISYIAPTTSLLLASMPGNKKIPVITMFHFPVWWGVDWKAPHEINALTGSARVQVLTRGDLSYLKKRLPDCHALYIPNIVPAYEPVPLSDKEGGTIINVARLDEKQKRQHLLIDAFARVAGRFPKWTLELWGDPEKGEDYTNRLKEQIRRHGLEDRIHLCGHTSRVYEVYKKAEIFAFPSAYEGFPLAMTEAMSAGLPVLACRSCEAAAEIIENGKTGLLAEEGAGPFAEKLAELMMSKELRKEIGAHAHEAMKAYRPEKIWDQWEELVEETAGEKNKEGLSN